jgi:hypothetical protein
VKAPFSYNIERAQRIISNLQPFEPGSLLSVRSPHTCHPGGGGGSREPFVFDKFTCKAFCA